MIDSSGLLRLMTWLSPAFPVGGFNYSHGLEQAVAAGRVSGRDDLEAWLKTLVARGSAWNDAVLLAESWRCARSDLPLIDVAELAEALAGSAERHSETMNQGSAFLAAALAWPSPVFGLLGGRAALPVAVGALAGASALPLEAVIAAFLQAFVTSQTQAAQRLMPLGQTGAVAVLASLEATIVETAACAARSTLDDLGTAALNAEIVAMQHETLKTRIFVT